MQFPTYPLQMSPSPPSTYSFGTVVPPSEPIPNTTHAPTFIGGGIFGYWVVDVPLGLGASTRAEGGLRGGLYRFNRLQQLCFSATTVCTTLRVIIYQIGVVLPGITGAGRSSLYYGLIIRAVAHIFALLARFLEGRYHQWENLRRQGRGQANNEGGGEGGADKRSSRSRGWSCSTRRAA